MSFGIQVMWVQIHAPSLTVWTWEGNFNALTLVSPHLWHIHNVTCISVLLIQMSPALMSTLKVTRTFVPKFQWLKVPNCWSKTAMPLKVSATYVGATVSISQEFRNKCSHGLELPTWGQPASSLNYTIPSPIKSSPCKGLQLPLSQPVKESWPVNEGTLLFLRTVVLRILTQEYRAQ